MGCGLCFYPSIQLFVVDVVFVVAYAIRSLYSTLSTLHTVCLFFSSGFLV